MKLVYKQLNIDINRAAFNSTWDFSNGKVSRNVRHQAWKEMVMKLNTQDMPACFTSHLAGDMYTVQWVIHRPL